MSNFLQAADAVRRLAKTYEQMVTAAAILEEIGSLDQARDERKAALAEADKQLIAAKECVVAEEKRLTHIRKEADADVATAKAKADIAANGQRISLDIMVKDAQAEAKRIVDAAKAQGDKIVSDAQTAADSLIQDEKNMRAEVVALTAIVEDKRIEIARLDDAFAKLRGKVAAIMEA